MTNHTTEITVDGFRNRKTAIDSLALELVDYAESNDVDAKKLAYDIHDNIQMLNDDLRATYMDALRTYLHQEAKSTIRDVEEYVAGDLLALCDYTELKKEFKDDLYQEVKEKRGDV